MGTRRAAKIFLTLGFAAMAFLVLAGCLASTQVIEVTQVVPVTQVMPVTQVVLVTQILEVRRLVDVTSVPSLSPTPGESLTFTVQAGQDWQPVGYNVPANSLLTLRVTGEWSFNVNGMDQYLVGPEGYPGEYSSSLDGQCWPAPMPEENKGALIGRVGSAVPFVVGESLSMRIGGGGPLSFRINDDCMGDNDGSLTVQIGVMP